MNRMIVAVCGLVLLSACAEEPRTENAEPEALTVVDTPTGSPVRGGRPLDHHEQPMDSIDESEMGNDEFHDQGSNDFSFVENGDVPMAADVI